MQYVLVLQWPTSDDIDLDVIVAIEDDLLADQAANYSVDGHDIGVDEANIFLRTDDPGRTFKRIGGILDKHRARQGLRVGYRECNGDVYSTVWPGDSSPFRVT